MGKNLMNIDLPQGYILDQSKLGFLKYGLLPLSKNGCAVVAVYNLLLHLGKRETLESVRKDMEKKLPFFGLFGTRPKSVGDALRKRGIDVTGTKGKDEFIEKAKKSRCGIVCYKVKKGVQYHEVAFTRVSGGDYRFYNAVYGRMNHIDTIEGFAEKFIGKGKVSAQLIV